MNVLDWLFTWFLAATLRGTLLACLVLLLQFAFRRRLPAHWRYLLWLPVIFVLTAPALPQSRWSLERFLLQHPSTQTQPAPLSIVAPPKMPTVVHIFAAQPPAPHLAPPAAPIHWRRILAAAWLAGASGAMGFMLVAYTRAMRQIRRGAMDANASVENLVAEAATAAGLPAPPRLLVSNSVQSPAVCGLFRPTLLLPAQFPQGFEPEEAHLVLLHEMTHLLRRDLLANWLLCVLQSLHWCNPALAFVFRRIRADREMACDAQVLALNGRESRADYGHALLKLQSALASSSFNLGFVGVFGHSSSMRSRIRAIASYRCPTPLSGAMGALVIAILGLTGATRAQDRVETGPSGPPKPVATLAPGQPNSARTEPIKSKLNSIIIPHLKFNDATFQDALAYLKKESVRLDPEKKGIDIIYKATALHPFDEPPPPVQSKAPPFPSPLESRITLELNNVPLNEALRYVVVLASLKFKVTDLGVIVTPLSEPEELLTKEWLVSPEIMQAIGYRPGEPLERCMFSHGMQFPVGSEIALSPNQDRLTLKSTLDNIEIADALTDPKQILRGDTGPDQRATIQQSLDKIIFKQFALKNATIQEAIDAIKKLGQKSDPEHMGFSIVAEIDPSAIDRRITLSLQNISMSEALRRVSSLVDMKYVVQDYAVSVEPLHPKPLHTAEESYITKRWNIAAIDLMALGCEPGTDAEKFLIGKGIDFPPGSSLEWYPAEHWLTVKSTRGNIARIEALLEPTGAASASK